MIVRPSFRVKSCNLKPLKLIFKMFFTNLVSFMSAGPVVALVLAKKDAIQEWRKLMGPTNPAEAKETYPDSIRALFGKGTLSRKSTTMFNLYFRQHKKRSAWIR